MSFVRTLVLALVALGLGAYLWFVEAPRLEQEAKANLLLDFDPAAIEKIRLSYPDGTAIEAVRDAGKWKLTSPVSYPADGSSVDNFLTTVKETKIERRLAKDEAGALSSYGLDTETGSQARLELTSAGKPLPAVVLGGTTPVGYQAFARREGSDEVLVIPLLLQSTAKKTPDELRLKTMFEAGGSPVKKVMIEKPGEKIVLERTGEEQWAMRSPREDAADSESVRSLVESLGSIDAVAFFDGDKADRKAFGLDDTATKVTAERDDGSTTAFRIGKEASDQPAGVYFERASDGQVTKVSDWVATKFAPPADELRDKRLLACRVDEVRSLAYSIAGESFTISRDAAGKPWTISPPVEGQVLNQRLVDNAVNSLVLARADAVLGDATTPAELAKWGLDQPVARLDVGGANGSCASLTAGPLPSSPAPEGDPAAAKRAQLKQFVIKAAARSAVLRASEHEYSRLTMKRGAFVDATAGAAGAAAAKPGSVPPSPAPPAGAPPAGAPSPGAPSPGAPPAGAPDPNELGTIAE